MSVNIQTSSARLDDAAAMAAFLAPIPNADGLVRLLGAREPVITRAFDDGSFTARFVASDGSIAHCHTIAGISIDQAELITLECERIDQCDAAAFAEAAQRALRDCPDLPP